MKSLLVVAMVAACSSDPPTSASDITLDSMEAARDKLLAGATEADLNADGSAKFRLTGAPGAQVEQLVIDGVVVITWTHAGDMAH